MLFILMKLQDPIMLFPCAVFLNVNYMKVEQFFYTKKKDEGGGGGKSA